MFYFHPFFFKITDPFDGRSFLMCLHDPFFGTNKNQILKNRSCERASTEVGSCAPEIFTLILARLLL